MGATPLSINPLETGYLSLSPPLRRGYSCCPQDPHDLTSCSTLVPDHIMSTWGEGLSWGPFPAWGAGEQGERRVGLRTGLVGRLGEPVSMLKPSWFAEKLHSPGIQPANPTDTPSTHLPTVALSMKLSPPPPSRVAGPYHTFQWGSLPGRQQVLSTGSQRAT